MSGALLSAAWASDQFREWGCFRGEVGGMGWQPCMCMSQLLGLAASLQVASAFHGYLKRLDGMSCTSDACTAVHCSEVAGGLS
jgi:hypothetical protein